MIITVETADFSDEDQARKFTEWAYNTPDNLFDPAVMFYPTTNTLVVKKDGDPEFFGPFQATITIESLAPKPGISPLENARCLFKFMDGIRKIAAHMGIREVFFTCKDESLVDFLGSRDELEQIRYPVFRMKVPGPEVPPVSEAQQ